MNILETLQTLFSSYGSTSITLDEAATRTETPVCDQDIEKIWILMGAQRQKRNNRTMMEQWNGGIIGSDDPTLRYSTIPITHIIKGYKQYSSKDLSP